jgi:hypothetical protein
VEVLMREGLRASGHAKDPRIPTYGALTFTVLIAAIGAAMMTVTSSPTMKGAAFLWLPAALQLIAGVWFGPFRGLLAGGLGAYAAGIIAYGGWGIADIIMNPIAGGLANSLLPAVLFSAVRINPDFGAAPEDMKRAVITILSLLAGTLTLSVALIPFGLGSWAYFPPLILLLIAPLFLGHLKVPHRDFTLAFFICLFTSALSALIGACGVVVSGQSWQAALLVTAPGWFLGDTVSAVLGLYMLASFTARARQYGLCSPYQPHS